MDTLAIVVDNVVDNIIFENGTFETPLIRNAKNVILIFAEDKSWFPINLPNVFCDSFRSRNQRAKYLKRKHILCLSEFELEIKTVNRNLNVKKIILKGSEFSIIKSCVEFFNIKNAIVYKSVENKGLYATNSLGPVKNAPLDV